MPAPSPLPHFWETTSIGARGMHPLVVAKRLVSSRVWIRFSEKKDAHDGILVTDPPYTTCTFFSTHLRETSCRGQTKKDTTRPRPTPRLSNQWSPRKRSWREPRASPGKSARALADLKDRSDGRGEACGVRRCVIPRVPSANVERNFSRSAKIGRLRPCTLRGRPPSANARRALEARFFSAHRPSPSHSRFSPRSTRRRQGREGPRHPRAVRRVDPPIFLVQLGEGVRRHGAGLQRPEQAPHGEVGERP